MLLVKQGTVGRAGRQNLLWEFDTDVMGQWKLLDAAAGVSGTPPSMRSYHRMVAVGTRCFVFGGEAYNGKTSNWTVTGTRSELHVTCTVLSRKTRCFGVYGAVTDA